MHQFRKYCQPSEWLELSVQKNYVVGLKDSTELSISKQSPTFRIARRNPVKKTVIRAVKIISRSSYNHEKEQLRHSSKKTCFIKRVRFSIFNFHISTTFPPSNVVTRWLSTKCRISTLKRGLGGVKLSTKNGFWNYGRMPIESVCSAQMSQHFCPWL